MVGYLFFLIFLSGFYYFYYGLLDQTVLCRQGCLFWKF